MRLRALVLGLLIAFSVRPATAGESGVVTRVLAPPSARPEAAATRTVAPAATNRSEVVRILAQFGATTRLCSGVMVAPRIALTAGRCVHQGAGGSFALDFWVAPGFDGTNAPFGQAFGSLLITFNEWTDRSDPDFDIGFVVLDRALGGAAGSVGPTRTDGCAAYAGALSWVGYTGATSDQVSEQGTAACSDSALTAASASALAAGSPLFASDGRVHAVSSTRTSGQVRFTRLNSRVLTYFTDSLLRSLDPCDVRLETDTVEFGAGAGEVMVYVSTGQGCTWSVDTTPPSWIEIQSGSGVSFGRPIFRASANTGQKRSAAFTIGGQSLLISQSAAGIPANARFAGAAQLGGGIVSTTVDIAGAGRDPDAPAPAGATGGAGAWWRWTAPTTAFATATVTSDRFSPVIGVYTGTRAGALTLVAEGRETVSFTAVAGISYAIFTTGISAGEGPVRLLVEQLFPGAEAQTGWWWNPNEPGRGLFIETNGFTPFLGWFAYDDTGKWLWQISRGEILTRRSLQGSLVTFRDGQTLGGTWHAPSSVGSGSSIALSLSSPTRATLTSGNTSIPLERFVFSPDGLQADRAPFVPETGWWWVPGEPGTGYAIEVQGDRMMIGAFHYDTDGAPRWSIAIGAMSGPRAFEGNLISYLGGQSLGQSYRAPSSTSDSGRITILFGDARHATVLFPSGRQVAIERFQF